MPNKCAGIVNCKVMGFLVNVLNEFPSWKIIFLIYKDDSHRFQKAGSWILRTSLVRFSLKITSKVTEIFAEFDSYVLKSVGIIINVIPFYAYDFTHADLVHAYCSDAKRA